MAVKLPKISLCLCKPNMYFFLLHTLSVMHESIPPAPSLPPGNRWAFASLVRPGGGALANLARPGGRALANPGGTPRLLARTWLTLKRGRYGEFRDKDQQFVVDWLVQQGLEKLVDVFKGVFS